MKAKKSVGGMNRAISLPVAAYGTCNNYDENSVRL